MRNSVAVWVGIGTAATGRMRNGSLGKAMYGDERSGQAVMASCCNVTSGLFVFGSLGIACPVSV